MHEIALDLVEVADEPVVHPQPASVAERVAVRLLDRRARRRANVREDEPGPYVRGELVEVPVVPGGLDAVERAGRVADAVPPDPEAVPVRRLGSHRRVQALVDERVLRLVEELLQEHRRARVREPTAHQCRKAPPVASSCTGSGCRSSRGSWRSRSPISMSAISWVNPRRTTTRIAARSVRFSGNV